MEDPTRTVRRIIMRRIYYAYVIRTLAHPLTVHTAFLAVCAAFLTLFVSVPNVLRNLYHVGITETPRYLLEAVQQTEVWSIVIFALMFVAIVSLISKMRSYEFEDRTFEYGT